MTYTDDSALPDVSDDMLTEALQRVRAYTIVILKAGPHFAMPGPDRSSAVAQIVWAHGKRNYALHVAAPAKRAATSSRRGSVRSTARPR